MRLPYSAVTPRLVYLDRRRFLGASMAALLPRKDSLLHNLGNEKFPAQKVVTTYNNFYEFGTGKDEPAKNAPKWKPDPEWPVRIEGEVAKPRTIALADIMKLAPLEERIYRMRCVEGWSMVVPWIGISFNNLLKQVELTSRAQYVAFESFYDPNVMLSSRKAGIQFPYVEGLRLDEAMHPLTLLAVGLYGETLQNQNGAPMRLVVPWKYGFKGIKSIAKIRLVETQPPTSWNISWPQAYGFYSNVNPNKPHPNWDQDIEQRLDGSGFLGQGTKIKTQLFNGYGAQVASMYSGLDLMRNY